MDGNFFIANSGIGIHVVTMKMSPYQFNLEMFLVCSTDEYWQNISSINAHTFNVNPEDFVLTGFKIMPYLSDHVYIWGPNILLQRLLKYSTRIIV